MNKLFDWRETGCAGRWSTEYPTNVLLAEDDSTRFVNELSTAMEEQQNEIQCCLAQLENTVGTDLKQVVKGILDRKSYMDTRSWIYLYDTILLALHCSASSW